MNDQGWEIYGSDGKIVFRAGDGKNPRLYDTDGNEYDLCDILKRLEELERKVDGEKMHMWRFMGRSF